MSENNKNVPSVIVDWDQLRKKEEDNNPEHAGEIRIEELRASFEDQALNVGGPRARYEKKLKEDLDALCHENEMRCLTDIKTGESHYAYTESGMKRYNMLVGNGLDPKVAYDNIMNQARNKFN
jgi:hypothetical protein